MSGDVTIEKLRVVQRVVGAVEMFLYTRRVTPETGAVVLCARKPLLPSGATTFDWVSLPRYQGGAVAPLLNVGESVLWVCNGDNALEVFSNSWSLSGEDLLFLHALARVVLLYVSGIFVPDAAGSDRTRTQVHQLACDALGVLTAEDFHK